MPIGSSQDAPATLDSILLAGQGLVSEVFDRGLVVSGITPAADSLRLSGMPLRAGMLITNLVAIVITVGVDMTHTWFALYSPTFALVAQTADTPAVFQSPDVRSLALTAPVVVPTSGLYYAAMLGSTATSMPQLVGTYATADSFLGIGAGQFRAGRQSGLAALPDPAVPVGSSLLPYMAAT